jgi:hypothetical protein
MPDAVRQNDPSCRALKTTLNDEEATTRILFSAATITLEIFLVVVHT